MQVCSSTYAVVATDVELLNEIRVTFADSLDPRY